MVPDEAYAISLGLDRTTVPMAECTMTSGYRLPEHMFDDGYRPSRSPIAWPMSRPSRSTIVEAKP
ncbi:MAG TPA: hypothetical protein VFT22_05750, partial [Kofleriaceae bacterium]|nr:hypothetical protein [Kofleriaceae bacterium]